MNRQINLCQPTLREPQRVFAAGSMLRTVAAVIGGLLVLHAYAWWQVDTLAAEAQAWGVARAAAGQRFDELQTRLPKRFADPTLAARVATLQAELQQTRELAAALNQGAFGNTSGLSFSRRWYCRCSRSASNPARSTRCWRKSPASVSVRSTTTSRI